jgi:hypothetical protein
MTVYHHSIYCDLIHNEDATNQNHFPFNFYTSQDNYTKGDKSAQIFENPDRAMKVCEPLANKIREELSSPVDLILSPATGEIIVGFEIGRQLGMRTMFCERVGGKFLLESEYISHFFPTLSYFLSVSAMSFKNSYVKFQ